MKRSQVIGLCVLASLVPVWALLQPRGYLGGFVLFSTLALGVVGMLFGGYHVEQPAFTAFDVGGSTGVLFPFLFVTTASTTIKTLNGEIAARTRSTEVPG